MLSDYGNVMMTIEKSLYLLYSCIVCSTQFCHNFLCTAFISMSDPCIYCEGPATTAEESHFTVSCRNASVVERVMQESPSSYIHNAFSVYLMLNIAQIMGAVFPVSHRQIYLIH